MPIVFAVQNPAVAQQLNLRLNYRVIPYGRPNATTDYERVRLNALPNNDTTFYAHDFVSDIFNKEGIWDFFWQLRWNNCTSTKDEYGLRFSRDTQKPVNSFVFTTRKNGSEPNFVAVSSGDECSNTQGIGSEVQDVLYVPPSKNADLLSSCAHVAAPAPTPAPCSASVPPEVAESISSRITQAACLAATPVVICPSQENASSRAASNMAVVALSLGLAIYACII